MRASSPGRHRRLAHHAHRGLAIAAFVVFHLLHLTIGSIRPPLARSARVFDNVMGGSPHLVGEPDLRRRDDRHRPAPLSRRLELASHAGAVAAEGRALRRPIAAALALALWAGFTCIPLAIYFGLVR
jgi:succinate dehydrogenase / fumarate reductase cytochrome b subunit